jgi:hypothetical protein
VRHAHIELAEDALDDVRLAQKQATRNRRDVRSVASAATVPRVIVPLVITIRHGCVTASVSYGEVRHIAEHRGQLGNDHEGYCLRYRRSVGRDRCIRLCKRRPQTSVTHG